MCYAGGDQPSKLKKKKLRLYGFSGDYSAQCRKDPTFMWKTISIYDDRKKTSNMVLTVQNKAKSIIFSKYVQFGSVSFCITPYN